MDTLLSYFFENFFIVHSLNKHFFFKSLLLYCISFKRQVTLGQAMLFPILNIKCTCQIVTQSKISTVQNQQSVGANFKASEKANKLAEIKLNACFALDQMTT